MRLPVDPIGLQDPLGVRGFLPELTGYSSESIEEGRVTRTTNQRAANKSTPAAPAKTARMPSIAPTYPPTIGPIALPKEEALLAMPNARPRRSDGTLRPMVEL